MQQTNRFFGVVIAALAAASLSTFAQTPALPTPLSAAPAASSTAPDGTASRLPTPEQRRDRGVEPGVLRPERPATPQISAPLGRDAREPVLVVRPGRTLAASGAGDGIDDDAARCKAQATAQRRIDCRTSAGIGSGVAAKP